MARKSWIRDYAPIMATVAVVLATLFPSRYQREVSSLRSDFDAVRADNDALRQQIAGVLAYIRDYDFRPLVSECVKEGGAGAVARRRDSPRPPITDFSFMRAGHRDGFRVGNEYWLVGDMSPWGRVESAFQGGFVADGLVYSRYSRRGVSDDE